MHVTTVPASLLFLEGHPPFMRARGFRTVVISSPGEGLPRFADRYQVESFAVTMERRITPLRDLRAVLELVRLFRELRPAVVDAHTPKGGLLGTIAATLAGVPLRVYHMRGLPFETQRGWRRALLSTTERISCTLATHVVCVSRSLRDVAIREGLTTPRKITVLGEGSGNGVDAEERFDPARLGPDARARARDELGLPRQAPVVGFVGRLVRDKGVVDLVQAWSEIRGRFPEARLLLVGEYEPRDPVPEEYRERIEADVSIVRAGFRADVERLYSAMDLVVLPSHREGFPNVPLEAAAMKLPVVASRVTGCVDAVEHGVTGTLVPVSDPAALASAICEYLGDPDRRAAIGHRARERVLARFSRRTILEALADLYDQRAPLDVHLVAVQGG